MTGVELQPCADCGQLRREIDSPRSEHSASCPHWEEHDKMTKRLNKHTVSYNVLDNGDVDISFVNTETGATKKYRLEPADDASTVSLLVRDAEGTGLASVRDLAPLND
jgi:hypothetical protein